MYTGLSIGKSGMRGAQNALDNTADQIANASTDGYKKKQVNFNQLLMNEIGENQVAVSPNAQNAGISAGSKAVFSKTDFNQGTLKPSSGDFHMAIEGRGFFGVTSSTGEIMLTRNGGFHQNSDNSIADDNGNLLNVDLYIPYEQWPNSEDFSVSSQGVISGLDEDGNLLELGQVLLYSPGNNDELISLGEGLYIQQPGLALYSSAENEGFGEIREKMLEGSNVDIGKAMAEMIVTQRTYQVNAKSVTTADEMLDVINTIV
ncbi:MAG TPA: flagellar hook-basal body protein [Eubacteriaceae bacterium]|jgi:flagellar basal-body rod protein FlgG|nr:flagellar hook-basal body protein [Eubacteriaceae bacterium]